MKIKPRDIFIIILIAFSGLILNFNKLNEFPTNIHAWAQFDRYALALKFTQNNLNFFKPETFVYNHIYPDGMHKPSATTITAVDFPIHDYLPGVIMKLAGSRSPLIFRLYILLYSLVGMFFLYRLACLWTGDFYKSLLVTILGATSPLFLYYQAGFLPTIPSLANAIIGIYFYSTYLLSSRNRSFNLSLIFLTLSALSRTTFLIPLLAVLGVEFIRVLRKDSRIVPKLLPAAISLGLIAGYWIYNNYLRMQYGSMFLSSFQPAESLNEAGRIIAASIGNWGTHYFTQVHYIIFALILIYSAISAYTKKNTPVAAAKSTFGFLIVINFTGVFFFAALLLKQFERHDYYFLDSFYLPVMMLLTLMVSNIPLPQTRIIKFVKPAVILLVSVLIIIQAATTIKSRNSNGNWGPETNAVLNYRSSERYLTSLGIPPQAKILVLNATAPNLALSLMNHDGYVVLYFMPKLIDYALEWDYDYIVFENESFIENTVNANPRVLTHLKRFAGNGIITVSRYSDSVINQTIDELTRSDKHELRMKEFINFDAAIDDKWSNVKVTQAAAFSGASAGLLQQDMEYGLTYRQKNMALLSNSNTTLTLKGKFMHEDDLSQCFVVVAVDVSRNKNLFYSTIDLRDYLKTNSVWEQTEVSFNIPMIRERKYELSVYIWNTGKNQLLYDDVELQFYGD